MGKIFITGVLFLTACHTVQPTQNLVKENETIVSGKLFTSAFQQKAAEYRALCFQAYNMARTQADQLNVSASKPKAIITDIDETVLDNSPYAVQQGLQGKDYEPTTWFEWTSLGIADTVPGAPSFLKYAASKGIEIFYVTNRDEKERSGTLKNLQRFALPNADNEHLLMRESTSSKEERRRKIMEEHEVIMFIGDNLADFNSMFEKLPQQERENNTNLSSASFGKRYILIPNPVYGYWEDAIYHYRRLTPAQKDSALRVSLKGY